MNHLPPLAAIAAIVFAVPVAAATLPPLQDARSEFVRHSGAGACPKEDVLLPVEAAPGVDLEATFDGGRMRLRYRMAFNQLTEGWNWHPEADPRSEDYYRHKFLPLKSETEERAGYRHEDKIGEPQQMQVRWRFDYFFAFDNLYDFYPRTSDDDAGFAAEVPIAGDEAERLLRGDLRMALRGRLDTRCLSESTTFWKATYGRPVDFTLKKRYLIGALTEVLFYDAASGRILARVHPTK